MVPNGWERGPVKNFGAVSAGRQRSPSFTNGKMRPYLRVANVFEAYIDTSDVNEMLFTDKEYQRYKLEYGDILLNEGQSTELVGRPAMYKGLPSDCCFQNTLVRFKSYENVNADYALQRFLLCLYDGTFQAISKKTTSIAHLGVSRFADLELNWPPLAEQKKIAKILTTWDKAITTTEQLLTNSQQQKKALMQQLLTGKKRLLDKNGVRFSGEWKHKKLSALCSIQTGKKDVNEGNPDGIYPFFTCANEPTHSDSYSYDCEALLIAGNGMLGKTHYYKGKFEAYQRTYILADFDGINVSFLHQYILYWLMRDIDREKQHGAMPYIKLGLLQNFKVFLPRLEEQQKIATVLFTADQEIAVLQQKLDALKQEKKALMQQLLTGKCRVVV